jgi:hypothetical protein
MNNNTIIEKAALTLSDLATGGLMNTAQSDAFLRKVQDAPTLINLARFVPMTSDSRKIEKIGFGQRVLRPGQEGVALTEEQKSKPQTSTIQLNAKEVIAEINLTYDTLENNIEKDGLQNTIISMLAERVALDLEELLVNGDTESADAYLALINGLRKQATSHVVDFAGNTLNKDVFKNAYKAMPAKYIRNPRDFRFFSSYSNEIEWKDVIGARQTQLGDTAIQGGLASAFGIPVQGISQIQPYTATVGAEQKDVSDLLLTHPKNIVVGMSRNISLEVDKDIRERKFIIVLTAKMDALFEEEDAVVKAINIAE